jgi:tRNA A37 methylthiotransferase MiaB
MVNPRGFSNSFLEGLLKAYESPKVFKFLHIPLQSGDDEVLKLMNRGYTVEEFRDIVSQFRRKFPQLTLATDIICGHPGESEEAHRRTIRLLEEIRPDIVNVSKFFPRPGTPAQEMNPLPSWKVKERTRKLAQICRNIAWDKNRKWLGWKGEILVEEKGRGDSWIGRNIAYKPVAVKSTENLLGRFLEVRVVETFSTHLEAVLLQ